MSRFQLEVLHSWVHVIRTCPPDERIRIERLHCEQGLSVRETAGLVGRDKATVSRELKRGLWFASNENGSYRPYRPRRLKTGPWTSMPFYSALAAQREGRPEAPRVPQTAAHGLGPAALVGDGRAAPWVEPRADRGQAEAGVPRRPGDAGSATSASTNGSTRSPSATWTSGSTCRGGRKHRARRKGRKVRGPRIPMRVPISQRPKTVDSRGQFGHRESDTIVGAAPSRVCIDTQVERKSRRPFARLVPDKSAMATARAEYEIYRDLPPRARIDRTWDNGTEASCHQLVDEALGMPAYFADPYSSWQRGSNENRNGRIRRYLPKKTPFDDLTQAEIDAIVQEINDTPMKQLEYKTPNEAWDEETSRLQSKTTNPSTSVALTS